LLNQIGARNQWLFMVSKSKTAQSRTFGDRKQDKKIKTCGNNK
jgi:hypothetical protein